MNYIADENGVKYEVVKFSYEGEPVYPPEPEGGYPGNNNAGVVGYPPVNQGPARVYRETEALPGPEYVTGEEYLPEYVARVQ